MCGHPSVVILFSKSQSLSHPLPSRNQPNCFSIFTQCILLVKSNNSSVDASVHDSQVLDSLLIEKDQGQELIADSAYTGLEQENTVSEHGMINKIHEKGYKNKPLTEKQIRSYD